MKKISFVSTILVCGALILAACNTPGAGVPSVASTPQAGTPQATLDLTTQPGVDQGTTTAAAPGLFATATPAGNATADQTGAGDAAATSTPETATGTQSGSDATATQAPAAGTGTDSGAQAGVENGLVRLSNIMQSSVTTSDNQQAGQVRGVLLTGPAISGAGGENPSVNVEGPAVSYVAVDVVSNGSGASQATVAPTSESSQGDANKAYAESWNQLAGQNDLVLVPWQAFNLDQAASTTTGKGLQSRLDVAALSAAPHFSAANPPDFGAANWNTTVDEYWASQGMGIAVTGTQGTPIGQPVLLTSPFTGINVSLESGQNVAQVQDFLVNPSTGTIEYVLLAGGNLGQRFLPVPAGALNWNQVTTLGAESGLNVPQVFSIGISDQMFNQAPSLDTLNDLGLNDPAFRETVDQYWQDFLNTGSEIVK